MQQSKLDISGEGEVLLSKHSDQHWRRRKVELENWTNRTKVRKEGKRTTIFDGVDVDTEIYPALSKLKQIGIQTEYSCAGVSPLDEPLDHSLYAYITFMDGAYAEKFAGIIVNVMKNRALLTYEPGRKRYDVSSFFIGHNRTFCFLIDHCAALMNNR